MTHINLSSWKGSITDWTELNYIKGGLPDSCAAIANVSGNYVYYNSNGDLEIEDNVNQQIIVVKQVKVSDLTISVYNYTRKIWALGDIADLNVPSDAGTVPNIYLYGFTTVSQNESWTTGMISVRNTTPTQVYVCDTTYKSETNWYNTHKNDVIYYW